MVWGLEKMDAIWVGVDSLVYVLFVCMIATLTTNWWINLGLDWSPLEAPLLLLATSWGIVSWFRSTQSDSQFLIPWRVDVGCLGSCLSSGSR
jgi:hypothetical protein